MLEKPVEQRLFTDVDNYHKLWSGNVAVIIESIYQNAQHFVSSYAFNPDSTRRKIISKMRIVPIDIKELLDGFFNELSVIEGPEPPRSSAG